MADVVVPTSFIKNWEKQGKDEVFKLCKNCAKDRDGRLSDSSFLCGITDLKRVIYELLWHVIRGDLKQEDALAVLAETKDLHASSASMLADLICIMDVENQCLEDKVCRDRFLSLVAASVIVIPEVLLKERLDVETLDALGLIQSQKAFNQKYVKTKTKLFYKQQKYNLLREESEGYAKLVVELTQETGGHVTHTTVLKNIKSLIGQFHLDPNRTLDIILECFECNLTKESFFLPLLKSYMGRSGTASLFQILGFKFQFYKDQPGASTPSSLFHLAALLIKHGLIELDDLYLHLSPSDKEIGESCKKMLLETKQEAKKMNSTILSMIETANNNEEGKENDKENEKAEAPPNNQKFGLCEALIMVGAWNSAKSVMDKLPNYATVTFQPIATALCKLVHSTIEPLYRRHASRAARGRPYTPVSGGPQQVHSYPDLLQDVFPMFSQLGPYLSCDPILMAKILRVGKGFLKEYPSIFEEKANSPMSPEIQAVWCGFLTLVDEVLLPSISLLECNSSLAEELWGMLKCYPYQVRYRLYGQWKNDSYSKYMELIKVKAETIKKARYITKRLTRENVKPSGRQIGKISHSNPGVVFEYLLTQIQKYDNFIGPVVDSLKYLTQMAYDVLAFCIIEALANPEKERLKLEDTNISDWLKSLAVFCGTVFRKYPIELTGLLQYVTNQLKAGKSFDLLVLKEVVQKMSGLEISEEVTMSQLEALCGGELLKNEGGYFGQIRNTKKSSQRLRDAVVDGALALPLCILMAQQRNGIVFFEDDTRHLKLVGKLYDQCQDTLVQFGGFLASQMTADEYEANLPSLSDLGQKFHLTPEVAFYLSRPMFQHQIELRFNESVKASTKGDKPPSQKVIYQLYTDAVNTVMEPIVHSARLLQTPKVWNNISPQLYVTFWSLSMYNVHVPLERYEAEIQRFKSQIIQLEENKEMAASKKKKDKERWVQLIDKLKSEQREQEENNQCVMSWLKHERDSWFPSKSTKSETITQFLQLCMFPRCVFTASDAVYCAKFVHTLHNLKTPNFSTLLCFDRVFSDISYTVASCTENEASRYGRFLCSMLEIVMRWHGDKKIYEKECGSYPGFVTVLRATNTDKADHLDYENFRHVCHKWQYKLTKALVVCLESKDYTQIRNTIMVLTKILPYYPKVLNLGQALERRIDKICEEEKEKRQDIYALAMGYSGQLKSKKKDMVGESDFHRKEKPAQPPSTTTATKEGSASTTSIAKQEKSENQSTTNSASETKGNVKSEAQDNTPKPKAAVTVKKENETKKTSSSPSTNRAETSSSQDKTTPKGSSSKSSGSTTPIPKQHNTDSPSRTTPAALTNATANSKTASSVSSSKSQSSTGRVVKTSSGSVATVKVDSTGSESEGKKTDTVKVKKDKDKKEEKEKDSTDRSKEKDKTVREKSKEKERSRSKEKERDKTKEKSKDKDKDKTPRNKHNTSIDLTRDSDYEKESKRRKIDETPSPSVQESTAQPTAYNIDSGQDKEREEKKSKSNDQEKDKDKERSKDKTERKRASMEALDGKEVKRRREDNDSVSVSRSSSVESKTKTKSGDDSTHKEKSKSSVKLVRKVTSESPVIKKEKEKPEKEEKEKQISKKKELRHENAKDNDVKDEESKSRRHHRSSSRRT